MTKLNRIGESNIMNCGINATIIGYFGWDNITIQFDDGEIVKNKLYSCFKKGTIKHPKIKTYNYNDRTGEKRIMNCGMEATIINYDTNRNISVKFEDGTVLHNIYYENYKNGKVENPNIPTLFNRGYIGIGKYKGTINGKQTSCYRSWVNMFHRCYNEKFHKKNKTYIDCEVDERFYCFQDFAKWYYDNTWGDIDSFDVDKDILVKGNKLYSPETCCLVDDRLNGLFVKPSDNNLQIGVYYDKRINKYVPQLKEYNTHKYYGIYDDPIDAFYVYKKEKERLIKDVANQYKNKYEDFPQKIYNAMINYEVEITD